MTQPSAWPHVGALWDLGPKNEFCNHLETSLSEPEPPEGLGPAVQALWWDAKGNWEKAHECAQQRDNQAGMRVHAYLHRKEGDQSNADYWYRRCGVTRPVASLDEEWGQLAQSLLKQI